MVLDAAFGSRDKTTDLRWLKPAWGRTYRSSVEPQDYVCLLWLMGHRVGRGHEMTSSFEVSTAVDAVFTTPRPSKSPDCGDRPNGVNPLKGVGKP